MDSITVSGLGKCYRTNRGPSPWQQLKSRFGWKDDSAKRPREIWALRDVSFTLERGTILGVIGPNGAGKTTLLKILARVTPPTEGRVVGHGTVAPLLELGAGLQADMTARDNISMYMTWHGISKVDIEKRMADIVAFAEIDEFLDTPLKRFSSGMYVRLAFSIAVNMQPNILLADEILAVGDLSFQERCLQRVKEAGAAGMTVLFVSHDMAAIQRLCNRVIWLNAGRVVQDGEPAAVVSQYEQAAWTLTARRGKKGGHVNDHGEILSVRLLSGEGREIGAARQNEELFLTTTCTLLTPGTKVHCVVSVFTRGFLAFRTAQPEELQVVDPGIFRVSIRIPPHLLADAIYSVKVGIRISKDGHETTIVQDNALTFRVYAAEDATPQGRQSRDSQGYAFSGAVMPRLDWQVSRERDVVVAQG